MSLDVFLFIANCNPVLEGFRLLSSLLLSSLHNNDAAKAQCSDRRANSFNSSLIYSANPFILITIGSLRNNGKQTVQSRRQSPSD